MTKRKMNWLIRATAPDGAALGFLDNGNRPVPVDRARRFSRDGAERLSHLLRHTRDGVTYRPEKERK